MGTHLSNTHCQKRLDSAKKPAANKIKATSKRETQKTAETSGDLIGNKIEDKITKSSKVLYSKNNSKTDENELEIPRERYISPKKRQQIIGELRLT